MEEQNNQQLDALETEVSEKEKKPISKNVIILGVVCAIVVVVAIVIVALLGGKGNSALDNEPLSGSQNLTVNESNGNNPTDNNQTDNNQINNEIYSQGLVFTSNNDGTCYVSGIGSCKDTEISIPPTSPNGDIVTGIGKLAFYFCERVSSIIIPENVRNIGDSAFLYCFNLTNVSIPDSVINIGKDVVMSTEYYNNESNWENGVLYIGNHLIKAKTTISGECVIKDGIKVIADSAFYKCENITSIIIPDSLTSIGTHAFADCKILGNIVISKNITSIGKDVFFNTQYYNDESNWENGVIYIDDYLIKVQNTISGEYAISNGTKVIADNAFNWCINLTKVNIPNSVINVGNRQFSECTSLISINADENNQHYKTVDGNLYSKDGKTLIYYAIGKTNASFETPVNVTTIGDYAFAFSTYLTNVIFSDSVTGIGEYSFWSCKNLTNVTLGTNVLDIGNYAFDDCIRLTSIVIPDSVKGIGEWAFSDCNSISRVTIGKGVTNIGAYAFSNCKALTDIYYAGSSGNWADIKIGNNNDCLSNAAIHYNYTN